MSARFAAATFLPISCALDQFNLKWTSSTAISVVTTTGESGRAITAASSPIPTKTSEFASANISEMLNISSRSLQRRLGPEELLATGKTYGISLV